MTKTPEEWLNEVSPEKPRGIFKLFLGYAPGVGKTYNMLSEAIRRHSRGEDVAIGVVETHGRKETADLITDLEIVPRRHLEYRGVVVEEMDLDYAVRHCAWCDIEVDDGQGRFAGFKLANRERWAHREGLTVPLDLGGEQIALGVMSLADSDAARSGDDFVFRACTSRCEKALRKAVPKALRKIRRP